MNILITSGGTTEKIDNVRSITNNSTGKLGCAIAEAFAEQVADVRIFYLCGKNAVHPNFEAEIIEIGDVDSVQSAIRDLFGKHSIDIIIHAMAISDYRVRSVATPDGISLEMADGKISSEHDEIIIRLEKAPKIIGMLRGLSPKAIIVGFKLLSNVPRGTLLDVGYALLMKNDCDFVLANDATKIAGDMHKGFLIGKNREFSEYDTKADIARAIVEVTLKHRRENR
ncbi:MAG: phosphopantothenate--cysteine ligase [Defluviitaleaceae bacterium]|nr:phosphopantothenate--cysteine ligase [Defluviitaleaceae bacterium]